MSAPHLTLIQILFAHKKLIQCLAWHPESTATDIAYSPYRHWLAVSSNETHIKVFDLAHLAKGKIKFHIATACTHDLHLLNLEFLLRKSTYIINISLFMETVDK
jgi:hypothetical protein